MKTLFILALLVAFCLPASAELLVFQTITTGQQFDVENKIVEKKNERGYLVINADLSNTSSVIVSEAYHLHYEKKAGVKIQYTTILNAADVELILVDFGKNKKMVLRWFDDPTGTYTVVQGTAAIKDIGGLLRYAPGSGSGCSVWREQDYRTGSGNVKFKLDLTATKLANAQARTVEQIIDEYEQILEQTKGYTSE
jgi:hypothetical protein